MVARNFSGWLLILGWHLPCSTWVAKDGCSRYTGFHFQLRCIAFVCCSFLGDGFDPLSLGSWSGRDTLSPPWVARPSSLPQASGTGPPNHWRCCTASTCFCFYCCLRVKRTSHRSGRKPIAMNLKYSPAISWSALINFLFLFFGYREVICTSKKGCNRSNKYVVFQ